MFLRTDQFTSSVRIETLFDTCFTLSSPKIFFQFRSSVSSCFLEISASPLRDVTGEALLRLAVLRGSHTEGDAPRWTDAE